MAEGAGEAAGNTEAGTGEAKPADGAVAGNPDAKPAAEAVKERVFKLKIDGKEEEWTESKVLAYAQKSAGADKRFEEAAKWRKDKAAFEEALEKNTEKALQGKLGDERFEKVAVEFLQKKLKQKMMTPEQRRISELEDKLKEHEETKAASEEAKAKIAYEAEVARHTQRWDKEIPEALDSVGLTKSPYTISRMADLILKARQNKLDVSTRAIADMVKDEIRGHIKDLGKDLSDEKVIDVFGDELGDKFSRQRIAKLSGGNAGKDKPAGKKSSASSDTVPNETNKMTPDEYEEYIQKVIKGEV